MDKAAGNNGIYAFLAVNAVWMKDELMHQVLIIKRHYGGNNGDNKYERRYRGLDEIFLHLAVKMELFCHYFIPDLFWQAFKHQFI